MDSNRQGGNGFLDIRQGRRWEKVMLVQAKTKVPVDILCRFCLRTFMITLKESLLEENTVAHCPFCRSARVVPEADGPETKATARKEVEDAAKEGFKV
jgi:hypothetical protein